MRAPFAVSGARFVDAWEFVKNVGRRLVSRCDPGRE